MKISSSQSEVALLQQLLDRAMRPGDPVTLDAWICTAEGVFKTRANAERPAQSDPSPPSPAPEA